MFDSVSFIFHKLSINGKCVIFKSPLEFRWVHYNISSLTSFFIFVFNWFILNRNFTFALRISLTLTHTSTSVVFLIFWLILIIFLPILESNGHCCKTGDLEDLTEKKVCFIQLIKFLNWQISFFTDYFLLKIYIYWTSGPYQQKTQPSTI